MIAQLVCFQHLFKIMTKRKRNLNSRKSNKKRKMNAGVPSVEQSHDLLTHASVFCWQGRHWRTTSRAPLNTRCRGLCSTWCGTTLWASSGSLSSSLPSSRWPSLEPWSRTTSPGEGKTFPFSSSGRLPSGADTANHPSAFYCHYAHVEYRDYEQIF